MPSAKIILPARPEREVIVSPLSTAPGRRNLRWEIMVPPDLGTALDMRAAALGVDRAALLRALAADLLEAA